MVEYKAKNSSLPYKVLSLSNVTTSVDITGLLEGTSYEIRVAAVSTIGTGAYTRDYVRTHEGETLDMQRCYTCFLEHK